MTNIETMKRPYYIIYVDNSFHRFKYWGDAKTFIENHDGCFYKKVTNSTDEKLFIQRYEGKKNYAHKTYIIICDNIVYRYEKWSDAKSFIDQHSGCLYKGFTPNEDKEAQQFINRNIMRVQADNDVVLKCVVVAHLNKTEHVLRYGYRLIRDGLTIAEQYNDLQSAYPADINRKSMAMIKKAVLVAIDMKEERIVIMCGNHIIPSVCNGTFTAKTKEMNAFQQWISEKGKCINIDFVVDTNI